MTDKKYFQFPLFLLRDLMTDKHKALNNIISYGLYAYSETLQPEIKQVMTQLMYCYYRNQKEMPKDLLRTMQRYIDNETLLLDEDYNGFVGNNKEFNPEYEIEQLTPIFEADIDFQNKAIEFYKIRQAYNYIGVTGDFENSLKVGKQIQSTIPKGEPMPMINKNQLFEYRDDEKTEFELIQFAVNIAIRSIIGQSSYTKTNKQMILCRAFGYSTIKYLPETMPAIYYKYSNRYHIDKVVQKLEIDNWNLSFYASNMRGMYIGLKDKISLENLIETAEMKKEKTKIENLKAVKKLAQHKALIKIRQQQTQQ